MTLTLDGPDEFLPLQSSTWRISFQNSAPETQIISWPRDLAFWLIDPNGRRVPTGANAFGTDTEDISVQPGEVVRREFSLNPEVLVGEPLGVYRVFVELSEHRDLPRTPSNARSASWRLPASRVAELIEAAAAGPQVGLRNAPLKLLRTCLDEIRPALDTIERGSLSSAAQKLASDLSLAACLKSIAPKPSQVDLAVTHSPAGAWTFSEAAPRNCIPENDLVQAVRSVLSVRRHLGCEFAVVLEPTGATTLGTLFALTQELEPLQRDLARPPRVVVQQSRETDVLPGTVQFRTAALPANVVLRIRKTGDASTLEGALRLPDPAQPQRAALFGADELEGMKFSNLKNPAALEAFVLPLSAPRTLVHADPRLTWTELLEWFAPLLRKSLTVDVVRF
jgi:hypothetical protein